MRCPKENVSPPTFALTHIVKRLVGSRWPGICSPLGIVKTEPKLLNELNPGLRNIFNQDIIDYLHRAPIGLRCLFARSLLSFWATLIKKVQDVAPHTVFLEARVSNLLAGSCVSCVDLPLHYSTLYNNEPLKKSTCAAYDICPHWEHQAPHVSDSVLIVASGVLKALGYSRTTQLITSETKSLEHLTKMGVHQEIVNLLEPLFNGWTRREQPATVLSAFVCDSAPHDLMQLIQILRKLCVNSAPQVWAEQLVEAELPVVLRPDATLPQALCRIALDILEKQCDISHLHHGGVISITNSGISIQLSSEEQWMCSVLDSACEKIGVKSRLNLSSQHSRATACLNILDLFNRLLFGGSAPSVLSTQEGVNGSIMTLNPIICAQLVSIRQEMSLASCLKLACPSNKRGSGIVSDDLVPDPSSRKRKRVGIEPIVESVTTSQKAAKTAETDSPSGRSKVLENVNEEEPDDSKMPELSPLQALKQQLIPRWPEIWRRIAVALEKRKVESPTQFQSDLHAAFSTWIRNNKPHINYKQDHFHGKRKSKGFASGSCKNCGTNR